MPSSVSEYLFFLSSRLFSFLLCPRQALWSEAINVLGMLSPMMLKQHFTLPYIFRHQRECLAGVLTYSSHRCHSRKPPRDENERSFFISLFVVLEDSIFSYISPLCSVLTRPSSFPPRRRANFISRLSDWSFLGRESESINDKLKWQESRGEEESEESFEPQQVVRLLGSLISSPLERRLEIMSKLIRSRAV